MAVSKSVLGMNARNFLYIRKYNSSLAKKIADDKLRTKSLLTKSKLPTTKLITSFKSFDKIRNLQNLSLPDSGFAIKPARGYEGGGILVFKKWSSSLEGTLVDGSTIGLRGVESHLFDILDGAYSLQFLPDKAFIEERVIPDLFIKRLCPIGLADIRLIVFNKVPIMAMLRIPTEKSDWKANITKGAIGIGIDIRTGITTYAISEDKPIDKFPNKNTQVRGLKIPHWDEILLLSSQAQVVSRLGFAGIDIVLDQIKGPLVLEVNARPGLGIQLANRASLRTRLERVEYMQIPTSQRGVELAKSLFAESLSSKIKTSPQVLSVIEKIIIRHNNISKIVEAKIDTGAYRTSIDEDLIKELNIPILPRTILVKSATGEQERPAVKLHLTIDGKKIATTASIASRSHLRYPIIVGRRDLKGFWVNPQVPVEEEDEEDTKSI